MRISLVVAASANDVIGVDGRLPWQLSDDLRRFRRITMGHPMIMGRRTWESIGRPLPGRTSIVLTARPDYRAEGAIVVHGPAEALSAAGDAAEVMVIGGGQVYRLFLPVARRIYMTRVETVVEGDASFPRLDQAEWQVVQSERFPAGENREHAFRFELLERVERF